MHELLHFTSLYDYCRGINITPPKSDHFDIRSFEENMKTVRASMPQFKHEYYAVAIKLEGGGFATTGAHNTKGLEATVFFNSPYQILHWDIVPDWKGYYIIFSEDFYRQGDQQLRIAERYPFLLHDNTTPLTVSNEESQRIYQLFHHIYVEHQQLQAHQEEIIRHYVHIILLETDRLFRQQSMPSTVTTKQRDRDLDIVARFRALIETSFYPDKVYENDSPHQVQFYADKLRIHPNHLNALVNRITNRSASDLLKGHLLNLAKSYLKNSNLSVKEIAYALYFNYPNHFSTFFKQQTGLSPKAFREQ